MSYLVLARKYRSRDFEALVGQEHVVKALTNALTQQRLHHAYLFTGTRGVGKTSVSRILAKALNCTGPDGTGGITAQPCGVCDACRDIDAGRFVDYVELDAASNRGVEDIAQLLDQAVYKPVVGRFKVYLIDEVHMLSNTAFNAMLKTLEEPPEYLKFVLATTDPQKVPPTVLSRCLQFNLRPMAPQTVNEHLARVLVAEKIDAEAGALRLLARAARGSMRDALSLTDQAIAFGGGSLTEANVRQMLGAVDRSHAVRLIDALAANNGAGVIAAVDGLRGLGLSASGTLEEMAALLQQMAVLQAVPDALDGSDPDAADAARLALSLSAEETQLLYSIVLHGRAELGLAPDEYSGLVMVLLRMLAFKPGSGGVAPRKPVVASPQKMADRPPEKSADAPPTVPAVNYAARAPAASVRPASPPAVVGSEPPPWLDVPDDETPNLVASSALAPAQTEVRRPVAPAEGSALQRTALGDRWEGVVRQMIDAGSISALARELALQAECIAIDEQLQPPSWRLCVQREALRAPAQRDKLQAALSELLQQPVQLEVQGGSVSDSPSLRAAEAHAKRQALAEEIIHNDPVTRAVMEQFRTARIVPGSIKPQ